MKKKKFIVYKVQTIPRDETIESFSRAYARNKPTRVSQPTKATQRIIK